MLLTESKEITVHFWNGRTATVPLGGVRWGLPAVWKKAVEKLHKLFAREHPAPLLWAPRCSLLGSPTGPGLPLGTPLLCPPCHPLACCQRLCWDCLCSSPLAGPTWWPLTRTSGLLTREHPEAERKPTAQLMPLEGPEEEEALVQTPRAVSSSSPASSEEDLENDPEMGLPQRLIVDRTVNTDPVLLEKSSRRQGGLCQPKWRYWRRHGYEPCPGKPGTRCCNIQKEEKGNQRQRAQTVLVGNTEELVLVATTAKPLQILPEEAKHRKQRLAFAKDRISQVLLCGALRPSLSE
ncbi:hypothetical protein MC885_013605 [Smutsia gigantea]|nr:hypothetical protein MC885_013605 [Smutsia gigantea]